MCGGFGIIIVFDYGDGFTEEFSKIVAKILSF